MVDALLTRAPDHRAGYYCSLPEQSQACPTYPEYQLAPYIHLYSPSTMDTDGLLADDPTWADVVPIRQYENVNPIAPIFYSVECPYGPCPFVPFPSLCR